MLSNGSDVSVFCVRQKENNLESQSAYICPSRLILGTTGKTLEFVVLEEKCFSLLLKKFSIVVFES